MKVHVRPTRATFIAGILVGVAFLAFGIVFLVVLYNEGSQVGVAFMSLWIFVVGLIIALYAYHLFTRKAVVEIDTEVAAPGAGSESDFDATLRKLERLKADRLISEAEYTRKRAEILDRKWS